jgi:hypothetical protein
LRSLLGTGADQSGGGAAEGGDRPGVTDLRLYDPATLQGKGHYRGGESMVVDVDIARAAGAGPVAVRLAVTGPADVPMWVMDSDPLQPGAEGTATVRFIVKELPQLKGIYAFAVAVRDPASGVTYDARRFGEAFVAAGNPATGVVEVPWTAEQVLP